MKPRALLEEFTALFWVERVDVAAAPPETGLDAMLRFYEQLRVDGCALDADGDMLLYQWGTYDWGKGPTFELDLTRQVILPDHEDDDAIWQLHLTYRYAPTDELRSLGSRNRWCRSTSELAEFRAFVTTSAPYQLLHARGPGSLELSYECAG